MLDVFAFFVEATEQFVDNPVSRRLAVPTFGDALKEIGIFALRYEHGRVVGREAIVSHETCALGIWEFRQIRRNGVDPGALEFERQKIRIREITIVMGLFLRAHRAGLAGLRIK